MKNLIPFIISVIILISGNLFSQDNVRKEFEEVYEKIEQYDDSEYKLIITDLVAFLDKNPNYQRAKVYLYQVLYKYLDRIADDTAILYATIKHFDMSVPFNLGLFLVYFYSANNSEKVQEVLDKITAVPATPKFKIRIVYDLNINHNRELYTRILTSITPYMIFENEAEKGFFYYVSGQIFKLTETYKGKPVYIPLPILCRIDPNLYPDIFIEYFSQSLPQNPDTVLNNITDQGQLNTICNQYRIAGNVSAYNYIRNKHLEKLNDIHLIYSTCKYLYTNKEYGQYNFLINRIYNSINNTDTMLSSRFYWGLSCLELNQNYKARQFLSHLFLYSKDTEAAYFQSELEWWASEGLSPATIKELLTEFRPSVITADNNIQVNVKNEEKSPALTKPPVKDLKYGTSHALLIAVQDYQDDSIEDLQNPLGDARRFRDLLTRKYNFEESNITMLENPGRTDIFNSLTNYIQTLKTEDNLLVFYAGHGHWIEDISQGYWIPADASAFSKSRWIANTALRDILGMIKSKHTLLITDACFSGAIFKERDVKDFNMEKVIDDIYNHSSRKAITSGALREVPDKSIFIEKLLNKLEENEEKYLLAEDLYYSIRKEVINQSSQVPLYGTIISTNDEEKGDFIFVSK